MSSVASYFHRLLFPALSACLLGGWFAVPAQSQPDSLPFSCRIVDGEGKPVPQVLVLVPQYGSSYSKSFKAWTDANGHAVFPNVSQSRPPAIVAAWKEGYTNINRRLVDAEANGTMPVLQLRKVKPIRVRLIDRARLPLSSVKVAFFRRSRKLDDNGATEVGNYIEALQPYWKPTILTDEQGYVQLPWAADGDGVVITMEKAGYQDQRIWLSVPKDYDKQIFLQPEARVRGRLIDAQGKPLANLDLSLTPGQGVARTDAKGNFLFERFGQNVSILALVNSPLAVQPQLVSSRRGEELNLGNIRALPAGVLSGKARVPQVKGQAVLWYQYNVVARLTGDKDKAWYQTARLEDGGLFSMPLFPGRYRIALNAASKNNEAPESEQEVTIEPGKTVVLNLRMK